MATSTAEPGDELQILATEQRRELMAAKALQSDLDFAFHLQMQEAIDASLSLQPCASSSTPLPPKTPGHPPNHDVFNLVDLQTEELDKFGQEFKDRLLSEAETRRIQEDIYRRIHDHKVALEIHRMPEDEWQDTGDNFEMPFGEGCSKSVGTEIFRVYFKGLVVTEKVRDSNVTLAGIGVAICDSRDDLIFELRKPLVGSEMSRQCAEVKALIEGLNAALTLDMSRVVFYCDYYPLYQFVIRRWHPKQRKMAALINQFTILQKKFTHCNPSFVARNDIKFAFKLAREAIVSQINRPAGSSHVKNLLKTCVICLEDIDMGQMFSVDDCLHCFCFSCMKQHVEVKLRHGTVPKCPHQGCTSELKVDSCRKFLTPKFIDIMNQRIREASIPVTERIYCPYPKCSVLMSKSEVLEYSKKALHVERPEARRCMTCQGHFCVNCKVPWHSNMSCAAYRIRNPHLHVEDAKLKNLAEKNLWRQCKKCNHMIELEAGCFHMTCRCGYEFCYTCGAEWKNKRATCSCPLWDEEYILDDDTEQDEDEDEDNFENEEFYDSDSDGYY